MISPTSRSINDKLAYLAEKLKIPFEFLANEFLLERLAVRLSTNKILATALIFKGGYVNLRVYESPRYTTDLDVLLKRGPFNKYKKQLVAACEKDLEDGTWFQFQEFTDLITQGEYGGLRIIFRAGIGPILKNILKARVVHLDIGLGDPVTPKPQKKETPFLCGGGVLSWNVYPIETIVSEKLEALIVRGSTNSRAKDIFDLNFLLPKCNPKILKTALKATFLHCEKPFPKDMMKVIKTIELDLLKKGWTKAVAGIRGNPNFTETFRGLLKHLKSIVNRW